MRRLGVLGPGLIAVHAVHLEPAEIALLRELGCHVAHCPSSNLKLASGIAPLAALHDARRERRRWAPTGQQATTASMCWRKCVWRRSSRKAASERPTCVPATQALEMATLAGARALGLERHIGSIAPGKSADLAAVDLGALEMSPCYHPVSHLVYAAGREQVTHVWVQGRALLEERRSTTLDTAQLAGIAAHWQPRIAPQS